MIRRAVLRLAILGTMAGGLAGCLQPVHAPQLGVGGGTGATVATRKMTSGANAVNYSLYRDALRTQLWGQTIGTDTVAGTGSGANQTLTIYGRVPAQAVPPPGTYSDAVTITVEF